MSNPLKIAALVSGSGSNLQVMIDGMQAGRLPIQIVGVISNNADAYANTRTTQAGIELALLSHTQSGKRMSMATFEKHALAQIQDWSPDLVVLAGFMRVLSADFIESVPCPIINLHPSLLPHYKGLNTHARVLASGERYHGCSVHLVTAELDAGKVLTQANLATHAGETADQLAKRVQRLEHQLVPLTLTMMASGLIDAVNTSNSQIDLPLRLWFD
ncbi:phosphoribosylglycinamide formyltransferase [Moraxella sp.]|uniref:phosphoribosylglycinamide formyltransferase n=1 Tax=Moraxella sp. TaxID=479 RepID=UPI0026DD82DD|nr:phosphoribosylglycinamide formyltransferase [Moraxella sp.]MDO4895126.1 phosphoribosylglycinamide formyltransferase [Moraxella sp.]